MIRDLAASSTAMLAAFGDTALLRAALRFESALARAQAAEGLLTDEQAAAVAAACADTQIDIASLAEAAAHAGTLAIPLVALLRQRAGSVHQGATSQDLADTALMLQAADGALLIDRDLARIADALAALSAKHANTPMVGRTLLQAALPITLGLKVAGWLLAIDSAAKRFDRECRSGLALQLGGAAGTLAGFGGRGAHVAARMASELQLSCPPMHWHARRDSIAGIAAALAIVTGALGKIARDIALLAQNEVAEAREPALPGRGGSSAMRYKRNPTGCQVALSAALRAPGLAATIFSAMPQEHERGLGGWQAEAPVLADLFCVCHGAILAMAQVVEGLEVDTARMAANLDAAGIGNDTGESAAMVARALATHERATHD